MIEQRAEAYKIYMSDSLVLINTVLSKGEVNIPRYADMIRTEPEKEPETAQQIISRFDKLRRQTE